MVELNGVVEAVSFKKNGWAIKVGENWYSGRGSGNPKKGDKIKLDYEDKEGDGIVFHNIKSFDVESDIVKTSSNDDKIIRQACLKSASSIIAALINKTDVKLNDAQLLTIQTAEAFKKYVDSGVQDL